MQDFKKLNVWEKGHLLVLETYSLTKSFPDEEKYGLISQMRRCAVSIPANIAEGTGKFTSKDTFNFFQISLGSAHELEYYFILSKDLGFIKQEEFKTLNSMVNEVKAMLIGLLMKRTKL